MTQGVPFSFQGRNPDILTSIANLSNDEVFTPPDLANQMLDQVELAWAQNHMGANLWSDPGVKFLDPFAKSGVFLREVTKRLVEGLAEEIPDLEERVDHVLTKQVFGMAITELTALLSRRSVYCSKWANGPHSVAGSFASVDGNIWFQPSQHDWVGASDFVESADESGQAVRIGVNGRCRFCGASQTAFDRDDGLETHAYALIHTEDVNLFLEDIFGAGMQFDVVIGNPPYQLNDGGFSASSSPIYQKFVEQAMALEPRLICMIIPSRWFGGGKGLDSFRQRMLRDRRLRSITDFIVERDAFPGVNINGGVNYFLWDRDYAGDCSIQTIGPGGIPEEPAARSLDEFDIFIRRNQATSILRKVRSREEATFDQRVSSRKPFGLPTNFHGNEKKSVSKNIKLYGSGRVSWVAQDELQTNQEWVKSWKVLVAAASDGNENYPLPIWDQKGPFVAGPGEACSETYLVAAIVEGEVEARNLVCYMNTKFFRFLVSLRKVAQHNKVDNFRFVPDLPLNQAWTDEALFERYELTSEEIAFIDSMIRQVEFTNA